ncbi:MAG: hypothetical protein R3F37_15590 [Candidatus Competibacteraceae bacterium]
MFDTVEGALDLSIWCEKHLRHDVCDYEKAIRTIWWAWAPLSPSCFYCFVATPDTVGSAAGGTTGALRMSGYHGHYSPLGEAIKHAVPICVLIVNLPFYVMLSYSPVNRRTRSKPILAAFGRQAPFGR